MTAILSPPSGSTFWHAGFSGQAPDENDFDRPLNEQGYVDAEIGADKQAADKCTGPTWC